MIAVGAVFLMVVDVAVRRWPTAPFTMLLVREDGILEVLQALSYLVAAGVCVYAAAVRGPTPLRLLFLVACVVLAGEEISWGQRIFDYSVPAVEAINKQGEFNLHNLVPLSGRGFTQVTDGASFLSAFFSSTNMFQMAFAAFYLALPLWVLLRGLPVRLGALGYVAPAPAFLLALWTLIAVSYFQVAFAPDNEAHVQALIEARETIFALTFLAYALVLGRRSAIIEP